MITADTRHLSRNERLAKVQDLLVAYGNVSGADRKAWVIDQALRVLAGRDYARAVGKAEESGRAWETGIEPVNLIIRQARARGVRVNREAVRQGVLLRA